MGKKKRSVQKRSKASAQKAAGVLSIPGTHITTLSAVASTVETVPISPSVKAKVRAILRDRGFTGY